MPTWEVMYVTICCSYRKVTIQGKTFRDMIINFFKVLIHGRYTLSFLYVMCRVDAYTRVYQLSFQNCVHLMSFFVWYMSSEPHVSEHKL